MPLSAPAPRHKFHDRLVECHGYRREDGLWDIEGHLVDTKTYSFPTRLRGEIQAGEPVHEMWLRLTIDEDLLIHEAEAVTDHGPFPMCPDITPRFSLLAGIRIGPGWTRAVSSRVGGVLGCTHLRELLKPMATTAYQTLVGARQARTRQAVESGRPPANLNTCHAYAPDSPVVREYYPTFYTGGEAASGEP
jgi:hypothetical protein